MYTSTEGPGQYRCEANLDYLWKVMATRGGSWRLEENNFKERKKEDLGNYKSVSFTWVPEAKPNKPNKPKQANKQTHKEKYPDKIIVKTIPKCIKDRTATGSSQRGFTKGKSCLTSLRVWTVSGNAIFLFCDSVNLLNNNGEELICRSYEIKASMSSSNGYLFLAFNYKKNGNILHFHYIAFSFVG